MLFDQRHSYRGGATELVISIIPPAVISHVRWGHLHALADNSVSQGGTPDWASGKLLAACHFPACLLDDGSLRDFAASGEDSS